MQKLLTDPESRERERERQVGEDADSGGLVGNGWKGLQGFLSELGNAFNVRCHVTNVTVRLAHASVRGEVT